MATIRRHLSAFFRPLAASPRALIYVLVALALLLVVLHQGSKAFFVAELAPRLLGNTDPARLEWWGVLWQFACTSLLFFWIPILLLKTVAKEKLTELGLGLGDWRAAWFVIVPIALAVMVIPAALMAPGQPGFQNEYPLAKFSTASPLRFLGYELMFGLLYYVSYEAFFRGFLQLGVEKALGVMPALLIQTSITTLLHINKPLGEIWSALAAGILFGLIVIRVRSVWPLVFLHWALGTLTDVTCAWSSGRLAHWFR